MAGKKMLKFEIITLFPELFKEHLNNMPFKRAFKKNLAEIKLHNLRDYAIDKRGTVDGTTYGGGVGMILMVEPIYKALKTVMNYTDEQMKNFKQNAGAEKTRVILLSPNGVKFNQSVAEKLSGLSKIVLICGRYEGVDARIQEYFCTDTVSIGDYVLSGGEIPALAIMEAVVRLIPGTILKEEATKIESFADGKLEYPQYSKPENFMGLKVPEILLTGNHRKIEEWRRVNSRKTQ
ncbi:tRNA (guanosine(37)-N1)-methyltransferase TrmD [candidate division WWE3 bacterium RIFCSPLOWO2_01_FULL_37_24]|uniref:tRNA (guanine-N(1)-)-methyltransferase n=1 Tax=candidate division WWE3 bacterium RIFCSPHIGHO2_02_FULL_38_14 TaxID=1802620 RepID=A0A1F4V829_UNCKA|nr:MAG: tRNA (guanosine(37)-N1)-methyltransferase TrmD [candidate division WWE3 bacterium RIFCSPHIGHO2_01_FULL_38_45]OGC52773.1 MAG: tRNA (guanosine(37)-N1)-methyltransferase TrmD [candidate division WWE3 bacterium RIFCSPHIGHO2_02_FULL_38_14]OGC53120.1 MAG: tRNA (guanosine(37)-N1)-methyltransferase TrmD [candidate division WWE3 bacterium RIFCSPLOWO2_01_FULL_37_24]HLB51959.1 tRNA (guanosine(37)-N1)-methyltransferase TrmD [Patescibacteria group bacterium]